MEIKQFLQQKQPVILDGAIGTLLDKRGYATPGPRWSAAVLEEDPQAIQKIHLEYLNAGAQIITTATFRTTSRIYSKLNRAEDARALNYQAVKLAKDAIGSRKAFIAGSVAPLEDCYRPDLVPQENLLYEEHEEQIRWLVEAGVNCLLFETMNTVREGIVCSEIASKYEIPFFTSFICNQDLMLLNGESLNEAYEQIADFQPAAFLVNCIAPQVITLIFSKFLQFFDIPVGAYGNAGKSNPEQDGVIREVYSPEEFFSEVRKWEEWNPLLIGGCCGTTPEHIRVISKHFSF